MRAGFTIVQKLVNEIDCRMETLSCIVVGDKEADKTELISSYTASLEKTAVINKCVTVTVDGRKINLKVWDTTGGEDYDRLRTDLYRHKDVFLMCFSIVSPTSFENIRKKWLIEVQKYRPNSPMILVGTNSHLKNNMQTVEENGHSPVTYVTYQQGLQLQHDIGAVKYVECSASTLDGVDTAFEEAVSAVLNFQRSSPNNCPCIYLYRIIGIRDSTHMSTQGRS